MNNEEQVKKLLEYLNKVESIELTNVTLTGEELGFELTPQALIQMAPGIAQQLIETAPLALPSALKSLSFESVPYNYPGVIETVELGATRANGGTREVIRKIGGHTNLPFYTLDSPKPVVTFDCFDIPISLPKPIRKQFGDAMKDPAEWAKKAVEFGADAITIHLISTDPYIKDTSPRDAAKVIEEVVQAVKVPLVIGGSGNPEKDPDVLIKAAEAASGERCLLAS
ncbi:MAG: CO dehydrogenase/acetyl-CoA synthase subunit delta, partial [Candidatus Hodarchaeales archaeon]